MIYTELTKKAMRIAYDAHKEQVDKTGLPYIFHPYHLAEQMTDEVSVCAALLHDVVEDTAMTFEDLSAQGIPDTVIATLRLLTHDESVPYMEYVKAIRDSGNKSAIAVKRADLKHNSDLSRLDAANSKDCARVEKYAEALNLLNYYANPDIRTLDEKMRKEIYHITTWYPTGGYPETKLLRGEDLLWSSGNMLLRDYRQDKGSISVHDCKNNRHYCAFPDFDDDITLIPGIRLKFRIFDEYCFNAKQENMIATFEKILGHHGFSGQTGVYMDISGNEMFQLERQSNDSVLVIASERAVASISEDKSFQYDSRKLVDNQYALEIDDSHTALLSYIFHAFLCF